MTDSHLEQERRRDPELRAMMERAAELGAKRALNSLLGDVTPHDPETREGMLRLRRDFTFLNRARRTLEAARNAAGKAALTAVTLGLLAALWSGLRDRINLGGLLFGLAVAGAAAVAMAARGG